MLEVSLIARDGGRRWDVEHEGVLIVEGSRDPEHDCCRVLLERGYIGSVRFVGVVTGRERSTVKNIETAARWSMSEESRDGLRRRSHVPSPDIRSPIALTGGLGVMTPDSLNVSPDARPIGIPEAA